MQKKTNNSKAIKLAVLGASLAGVAATAYFFFGPKGKKNQKHAKAWAIKMKGDVIEKLEKAKEITEPVYHQIINSVSKEYATGKKATRKEIEEIASDLRKHWSAISKLAIAAKKEVVKKSSQITKAAAPVKAKRATRKK